jgi:aryl-alcohol dehydrogenase
MAARLVGAGPIIGVDIKPKRLQLALKLGVTHAIDNRRQDVSARITEITGRGVDYVIETTGDPEMHGLAIEVLNPHGIVALLTGESGTDSLPEGRRTLGIIQGDAVPQHFIPKLIQLYRTGQFPFDRLLKFYDFGDINRAIADAKHGYTIKPVLRISEV